MEWKFLKFNFYFILLSSIASFRRGNGGAGTLPRGRFPIQFSFDISACTDFQAEADRSALQIHARFS